ncbi:hypothetical protein M408DRAFT_288582 [Serendipita vermifera MAFF 305830]|uniref:Asteroid domain-containing protein n=1 Tax=Serendipita vermifera MAFF 305830 TaxID=933852 RepID=A0A0C2XNV3_SERVB|nr:hypothetical protein M408DRAFT_288582 [Serendipita vermifera MAFF 305830]
MSLWMVGRKYMITLNNSPSSETPALGSFIYHAYQQAHVPWVYGGEYDQFSVVIQNIVHAWLGLGMHLSFVFDGPQDTIKFPTTVSRLTSTQVHHSELFFRTSRVTRETPRFLNETRIIPPLVYPSCTETLLKLSSQFRGVDVYFADREADPFIVELAGRLGAYVTAIDSDYVILNTPGYMGYIPLDEMAWKLDVSLPSPTRTRTISIASSVASFSISDFGSDSSILEDLAEFDEGGFVPVKKKRVRTTSTKAILHPPGQAPILRSLIPPEEYSALTFTVYTPDSVAASLGIPTALLPLLGAIVGNDFTQNIKPITNGASTVHGPTRQKLLFEHKLNAAERIVYAANALSSVLRGVDKKKKNNAKPKQRSVLELIRSTVNQMLVHPNSTTERQVDDIVNGIVESALMYAIPPPPPVPQGKPRLWPTPFCALHHDMEQCRLDAFVPVPPEEDDLPQRSPTYYTNQPPQHQDALSMVQNLYLRQYREGSLDPNVLDVLITGTMWPRIFLENPDTPSTSGPLDAAGSLREWAYAILDQGIGVYMPPEPEEEEEDSNSAENPLGLANGSQTDNRQTDSEEEDEDEVIDVVDDDDIEEAGDPLVALRGALQRLKGVSSVGVSGGLPTIPDQGDESEEEESVDDDDAEECYVTEYVRRGGRVAEAQVQVQDLNALLEKAVERDNGEATSHNFGQPSMHNHAVPRTSRSHPIQLAEERERLCVLLMACGSDTQHVRNLDSQWLAPVIITRWVVRWAGVQAVSANKVITNPLLKTWSKGEIAALLRAFRHEEEENVRVPAGRPTAAAAAGSAGSPTEMSDRTVQLMARTLSVIEAMRMLIQVLCLGNRVPLHLCDLKGRVFHEGCREANVHGQVATVDASVFAAVEEGLEEYIREDQVKKAKKKKEVKPVSAVKPIQKGVSFHLLAQLDASA